MAVLLVYLDPSAKVNLQLISETAFFRLSRAITLPASPQTRAHAAEEGIYSGIFSERVT